jgi:hypothetical protein
MLPECVLSRIRRFVRREMPTNLQIEIIREYLERTYRTLRTRKLARTLKCDTGYVKGNLVVRYDGTTSLHVCRINNKWMLERSTLLMPHLTLIS